MLSVARGSFDFHDGPRCILYGSWWQDLHCTAHTHAYVEQHNAWQPAGVSNAGDSEHLLVKVQLSLAQTCHLLAEVNCLTRETTSVRAGAQMPGHENNKP